MSNASEVQELLGFLKAPRADLRELAAQHVMGLTGTPDGIDLLVKADAAEALCHVVGDVQPSVSTNAVTALINLSDRPKVVGQMLKAKVVDALMEGLKNPSTPHKRLNVMLLCNLCTTHAGCVQLMSLHEDTVLVGLHLRRLIQWLVQPVPADSEDTFEYGSEVVRNVCQLKEARTIVMDHQRGIIQALLPQLKAASAVRRRGVAGALRHCAFDSTLVQGMLKPGLKLVEHIVQPLAGPKPYKADDLVGMPSSWHAAGAAKRHEPDAVVRRLLLETLVLVSSSSRDAREVMRNMKVYPVLKQLHEWIDEECRPAPEGGAVAGAGAGAGAAAGGDAATALVPASAGTVPPIEDDEPPLSPDDDATVEAVIKVVDLLLREEGDDDAGADAAHPAADDDEHDDDDDDDDDAVDVKPSSRVEEMDDVE